MGPTVTIIVLNHNGKKFLKDCFDSLKAQSYKEFEVIIVDNGSTDGSLALIREHYPEFTLIANKKNLGFAEGNNQGINVARGKYIVTLNNDTKVDEEWLWFLVGAADDNPEAGMFTSKILSMQSPDTIDSVGVNLCVDGMSRGRGRLEKDDGRFDKVEEIFFPSACAALYKKQMLVDTGPFDADFFAYCEDTDLGLRGRWAGWKALFVPEARVYHHYSGTGGKYSSFKAYLVERNHVFVAFKNFPTGLLLFFPFLTLYRYLLQFISILKKEGSASELAGDVPPMEIIKIIFKAYFDVLISFPKLRKKRQAVKQMKKISDEQFFELLTKYNLSLKELVFKK